MTTTRDPMNTADELPLPPAANLRLIRSYRARIRTAEKDLTDPMIRYRNGDVSRTQELRDLLNEIAGAAAGIADELGIEL